MNYYPSVGIDSQKIFDNTNWNKGSEPGLSLLNTLPPEITYNNSGFSDFLLAREKFSPADYPARTAVILFVSENGILKQKCSGVLVAYNYVLTDCHCVGIFDTSSRLRFFDSIWVYPAFDNGYENPVFGKSLGAEYITFKSNLTGFYKKDIALIKLNDDIGAKTGWLGIAFSTDDSYFENKVLHKFSYPGPVDPTDSSRIFLSGSLYYNYGTLDLITSDWIGYNITGIPGQSGSSLFYTNNDEYLSFGAQVWSGQSKHLRITPEIFYPFRSVINNGVSSFKVGHDNAAFYYISEAYPNPFNPVTNVNYSIPQTGLVELKLFDIMGREVLTLINEIKVKGEYHTTIDGSHLSGGVYFLGIRSGRFYQVRKLILLK
ncbi:MAG: T9SS type A sorting domain-containing protein [Ignavibacteriales bacterium]|nr:T9SS type A sorting domain-containing protein [Ignavibacteriales bacterium]MCF8435947.1 T9SS type A sorting domain-containing protein [Ignavibacteriales bacterium]